MDAEMWVLTQSDERWATQYPIGSPAGILIMVDM